MVWSLALCLTSSWFIFKLLTIWRNFSNSCLVSFQRYNSVFLLATFFMATRLTNKKFGTKCCGKNAFFYNLKKIMQLLLVNQPSLTTKQHWMDTTLKISWKPQSHMEQSLADCHYSVGPKCQQIPISLVLCSNFLKPVILEDLHKSESCSIL